LSGRRPGGRCVSRPRDRAWPRRAQAAAVLAAEDISRPPDHPWPQRARVF